MWRFCLRPFLASAQLQILRATHRIRQPTERGVLGTAGCPLRRAPCISAFQGGLAGDKGKEKVEARDDLPFQNVLLLWPNGLSVPYFLDGDGASSFSGNDAGFQNLHHNLAFCFYGLFQGTMARMSEQNERISDFSKAFRVMQIKTHYLRSDGMPGKWLLWPRVSKYTAPKINLGWTWTRFSLPDKGTADDQVSLLLLLLLLLLDIIYKKYEPI